MFLESGEGTRSSSASSEEIGRGLFAFPRVIRRRHDNGNVSEENVEEDASATTTTSSSRAGDDVEEEEEAEDPTAYLANFHFAPTHQQECQLLIEFFSMRQDARDFLR